eukprot:2302235-Alexandrium_andersonii.AAC.1
MASLPASAELHASRAGPGPLPRTPGASSGVIPEDFTSMPATPKISPMPTAKHLPAAKMPPTPPYFSKAPATPNVKDDLKNVSSP